MSPPPTPSGVLAEGATAPGTAEPDVPAISVVVPVRNEAPNVAPLIAEIAAALAGVPHEIIYVDDGSTDGTAAAVRAAPASPEGPVRLLRHAASCGQSAAIVTGIRAARAPWIATLDGDGQNDPADIPRLWARARAEGAETLVAGWRTTRKDTATKRFTSRIANRVRARLLGDATPDTGCGLKVFPRGLFLALPHFDHMHRFLPALVLRGGGRVVSEPVGHRPRIRGVSNYGTLDRLAVGIVDLLGMIWLQRRWRRPHLLPDDTGTP
ncbi:MAG TPA: glycosyltransferase family 2 protein [Roseomonas sp.]|jgi:dolichol-phosphate mannosyltransferase